MLIRIYFDGGWIAEWLIGCDVISETITFADALLLEVLL